MNISQQLNRVRAHGRKVDISSKSKMDQDEWNQSFRGLLEMRTFGDTKINRSIVAGYVEHLLRFRK